MTLPWRRARSGLDKSEVIHHEGPWRGMSDVELATAMWVDWFNTERLHGSIDRLCPVEFEKQLARSTTGPRPGQRQR